MNFTVVVKRSSYIISSLILTGDKSFIALSDGRLTARAVQVLDFSRRKPVVVLSACQTGQGRTMEAG